MLGAGLAALSRILCPCLMVVAGLAVHSISGAEEPWSVSPEHPVLTEPLRPLPPSPSILTNGFGGLRLGFRRAFAPLTPSPETKTHIILMTALYDFYRFGISPADGASCSFSPTCSRYAFQAVRRKGIFLGAMMAAERILRDHNGPGYPVVRVGEFARRYDPLRANEFGFWPDWPWYSEWPPRPQP